MVLCKDTGCKAALIAGIAIDEKRFICRDFLKMPGQFPDIHVVRITDRAGSAPVPDIPHIEKERRAPVEVLFELLN
jgi:hypothetical protein